MDGGLVWWLAERFSSFAVMAAVGAFASLCCAILYQGREPRRVRLAKIRAKRNRVSYVGTFIEMACKMGPRMRESNI